MAFCIACPDGREVSTHLYIAAVPYNELVQGGTVKAVHVGVRLPEGHLANYRAGGVSRHYLPALAGDTTGLEAFLRRLNNPRPDGSVQGLRGVIPAERVEAVKEDVMRAIDIRHGYDLTAMHCRGHELEEVVRVLANHPLPFQLRWNPGPLIRPLLTTPSPDAGRRPPGSWRGIIVRNRSDTMDALKALLEVK